MIKKIDKKELLKLIILFAYAAIWLVFAIRRCGYNVFWGDEAFTISFSKMSIIEIAKATANDVHPPLYYVIVKYFIMIFGGSHYLYRLASVVAFALLLLLAVLVVNRLCDFEGALLFITLASLLRSSTVFCTEARMYYWAILFVTITFLSLRMILIKNSIQSYILFTVFVLASAYTHYYALVSVGILCAGLLVFSVVKRDYLRNTIVSLSVIVITYLPWMYVLLKTFKRTSGDYWITTIPSFNDCMRYYFKSSSTLELVLLALLLVSVVYTLIIGKVDATDRLWVLLGLLSCIITAIVGITVSYAFRPMFQEKYLYPSAAIMWLILIYGLSRMKYGKYINLAMAIIVLIICLDDYKSLISLENEREASQQSSLNAIGQAIDEYDLLINCGSNDISVRVLDYFFPDNELIEVDDFSEIEWSGISNDAVVISSNQLSDDTIAELSESSGRSSQTIINCGYIGTYDVFMYRFLNR